MNIEEIKALTAYQLSESLVKAAGARIFERLGASMYEFSRGQPRLVSEVCSDLNAVAEVERIVIDKGLRAEYGNHLENIMCAKLTPEQWQSTKLRGNWVSFIAELSAREKAEACLLTLEANK